MTKKEKAADGNLSRRALLMSAGAAGAGLVLAQSGGLFVDMAAAASGKAERLQDVLDITVTNEAFGVTLIGTVLDAAANGSFSPPIPEKVIRVLTNVRAQEQAHLDFFASAGGKMRTDTFYLADPELLRKPLVLFADLVALEDAAIAASMAGMRTYTREHHIDLVKANFQFAAEEAEHRLLANHALGTRPANNIAFSPALFATMEQFYRALKKKGIVGGSLGGKKIKYPGAGNIDDSKIIYKTPGGPVVSCA